MKLFQKRRMQIEEMRLRNELLREQIEAARQKTRAAELEAKSMGALNNLLNYSGKEQPRPEEVKAND